MRGHRKTLMSNRSIAVQKRESLPQAVFKACKGPYKTAKQAVMAIFVHARLAGHSALYYGTVFELIAVIDAAITCVHHPIPRDRIESAIKSLCYEGRLKSRGDGYYVIHPLHLQPSLPNSLYNIEKRKIESRANRGNEGYVYYVRWENDCKHVKIGFSTNPCSRLNSFLTASPHRLEIIRLQEVNGQDEEATVHQSFDRYRVAGEWFKYEKDLKEYIEGLDLDVAAGLSLEKNARLLVHYF
jgi:hypothetical protein